MSKIQTKNPFVSKEEETLIVIGTAALVMHGMLSSSSPELHNTVQIVDDAFDIARLFVDRAKLEHRRAQS